LFNRKPFTVIATLAHITSMMAPMKAAYLIGGGACRTT
jgi:hypothetical protein